MATDRLNNIALLSNEQTLAEGIDLDDIVDEFDSQRNNHRVKLH